MGLIDNLDDSQSARQARAVRKHGTKSPLGRTSVTEGTTEFNGNESLVVKGSQKVSGWLVVTGTLKVVGAFLLEGITTITGALTAKGTTRFEGDTTQVGPHHVQGNQDITGTLAVKGATSLEATVTLLQDLVVTGGGKIRAGNTVINPTGIISSSGVLTLAGGGGIDLGGTVTAGGGFTSVHAFYLTSVPNTSNPANVYVHSDGQFFKVTSAARFKLDAREMELDSRLLEVPVKDWIDKGAQDRGEPALRVPGVIAEEVEAAGGSSFVSYDEYGALEGVAYDRFALARTQILSERLEAAERRIVELADRVATLAG